MFRSKIVLWNRMMFKKKILGLDFGFKKFSGSRVLAPVRRCNTETKTRFNLIGSEAAPIRIQGFP